MKAPIPVYAVHPITQWAPLALGLMVSCIQESLPDDYRIVFPFALNSQQLLEQVARYGPGVVLFSNYMWTREANLEISAAVKRYAPRSIVIHGGPDTPAYESACKTYLERYPFVDYTVHSEGEQTLVELLRTLSQNQTAEHVAGLGFLLNGQFIKTPNRPRSDPNLYPSPFLNGVFDQLEWQTWMALPLETNRGCPYGCVFCDWGSATLQKMRRFDLDRVFGEIEWLASHQVPKIWIADSNFGIFERDLEIAQFICDMKEKYGYPQVMISNYAKNTKKHLVDIIELLVEHGLVSTGIVSLQTRDEQTLKTIKRSNIKTKEYDALRTAFEDRQLPMSTQLMIGLPGSTRESFKDDLRFFFNQIIDAQIFRTVVLPNSPMAAPEFVAEHELVYDESGMLMSTKQLDADELNQIEQLARLFRCAHTYGMLRYWLCFLQWDYGLDPIEVLDRLAISARDSSDPWISRLCDRETPSYDLLTSFASLREDLRAHNSWHELYAALQDWTCTTFPQVQNDSAFSAALQAQTAVMPSVRRYPLDQPLNHDFVAYYQAHRQNAGEALKTYGPGTLHVEDPIGIGTTSLLERLQKRDRPVVVWELQSALAPKGTEADLYVAEALKTLKRSGEQTLPAA